MDQLTPMTAEAKMLNPGGYELADKLSAADRHNERQLLTQYLPEGRVLDQEQLDMIASGAQTWAPLITRRQVLAEAGARAIGHAMILTANELAQLREYVRAVDARHTIRAVELWRDLKNPVSPYLGSRRG
jgi:hypothetical protein